MRNEQLLLTLLADALPDGSHIFDVVWEKSALAAVFGLLAILGFALAYFYHKELRNERKSHCEKLDAKDAELASLNKLFREEMIAGITATQALVNKHEETKTLTTELRDELDTLGNSMKNGLRAIGGALDIPSERLKVD